MNRLAVFFVFVVSVFVSQARADDKREVMEVEIEAGIDEVWKAFTTTPGLQSWVSPLADIDLKIGGKWRANYNRDGKLGDESTIENTILSYDPKRMLSLKATGLPKGFPFANAAKESWTVFYFSPLSDSRTKIRVVGLGYTESEESQKMRSFFKVANKHSLDQLNAALKRPSKPNAE
ncbi:MAG: SRPBCC domain-containing protein [Planctomycetes bacterium]|nr:SRPBCC domain-containing protein [Planctomycetota bacterium]